MNKAIPILIILASLATATCAATDMRRTCVVANEVCFKLHASAGGFSPVRRMERVNERLSYILGSESLRPHRIKMVAVGGDFSLYAGHTLIVTVTAADARANGVSVKELATTWLQNLRHALPLASPYNHR